MTEQGEPAEVLGVIGDDKEIERLLQVHAHAVVRGHFLAHGEAEGVGGRELAVSRIVGIGGSAGVQMGVAEERPVRDGVGRGVMTVGPGSRWPGSRQAAADSRVACAWSGPAAVTASASRPEAAARVRMRLSIESLRVGTG